MATENTNSNDHHAAVRLAVMGDLVTPMAVRVMATLRIADLIETGLSTAFQLADVTNSDVDSLDRVLRHLVTVSVLRRDDSGEYSLTPIGEVLLEDHPSGARARLDIEGALGRAELSFVQLLHSVRTGEPAFPAQFGASFWDDVAADEARLASFDAAMGVDAAAWAPAIAGAFDWGSLQHLIDVGGGNGSLLVALLRAYTSLRGTVLDLPDTAAGAREAFAAANLQDRAQAVAGSFFDPLPPGADGYLLTAIVHDWDDEPAREILRRCGDAAGSTGACVFVIEKIGSDGRSPNTNMDLRLLAYMGGRERNLDDLRALVESAGLDVVAVYPAGAITILELRATRAR